MCVCVCVCKCVCDVCVQGQLQRLKSNFRNLMQKKINVHEYNN